jgi:hypothetical protein
MLAPLEALFEPWPVIGSFSTSTSPMPSTVRPEGSTPIALRTVGVTRPNRMPLSSVRRMSLKRGASHGKNSAIRALVAR